MTIHTPHSNYIALDPALVESAGELAAKLGCAMPQAIEVALAVEKKIALEMNNRYRVWPENGSEVRMTRIPEDTFTQRARRWYMARFQAEQVAKESQATVDRSQNIVPIRDRSVSDLAAVKNITRLPENLAIKRALAHAHDLADAGIFSTGKFTMTFDTSIVTPMGGAVSSFHRESYDVTEELGLRTPPTTDRMKYVREPETGSDGLGFDI